MVAGIVRAILRDETSITPGRGDVALREEDEGLGTGMQRGGCTGLDAQQTVRAAPTIIETWGLG